MDGDGFESAAGIAGRIRAGQATARSAVEACLDRMAAANPALNAVVTIDADGALALADRRDADRAAGRIAGPLHGVPITVKDTYRTSGLRTTAGYPPLAGFVPDDVAVIVRLLKDAGASVMGKTNTCPLAMDMQTDNPIFGRTANPWDPARTPGGSSGGCAAALAAGMTPLSFGSDLAGSLRLPASFCGVHALKPTHGVVSFEGHVPPLPGAVNGLRTLAVPGILARSIGDLQLAFDVIAAPTRHDRFVAPLRPDDGGPSDIAALRIAWMDDFGGVPVGADSLRAIRRFVDALEKAGAHVERAEPEGIDYERMWELWGAFVGAQYGYDMSDLKRLIGHLVSRGRVKDSPMQRRIVGPPSVEKLMRAFGDQSRLVTMMDNFLTDFDVWIAPVSSTAAFAHQTPYRHFGDFRLYHPIDVDGVAVPYYVATQSHTTIPTVTDSPVVAMPVGLAASGLPVGVQLIGRRYRDRALLRVAAILAAHAEPIVFPGAAPGSPVAQGRADAPRAAS